ncbi:MAG: hypothetical protein ABFS37_12925, partial [Acidobacteriota bacterium]
MTSIVSSPSPSSDGAVLRALLVTDLVDSTKLLESLGDERAFEIFGRHDRLARDLLTRHNGIEIDKTDGFLLLFDRPVDAVAYSLAYHRALSQLGAEEDILLEARAGIHLGEVWVRQNSPEDVARGAKPLEVEGLAKPMAARLMSLGLGGQTLLTSGTHDLAKRAAVGFDFDGHEVLWIFAGRYGFKGVDQPIRVFMVRADDQEAQQPPPDSGKAWRVDRGGRPLAQSRRRLKKISAAAAAVIIAAVAAVVFFALDSGEDPRKTLAVLGFANLKHDPGVDWISTALAETLSSELAGGGDIRTVPGEAMARIRSELGLTDLKTLTAETLALLYSRTGADYVVGGSYHVARSEGALTLSVWTQEVSTGEQLPTVMQKAAEDNLFGLVATTVSDLRTGRPLSPLARPAPAGLRSARGTPRSRAACAAARRAGGG